MVQIDGSPNVEAEQIRARQILLDNTFHWVYLLTFFIFQVVYLDFFLLFETPQSIHQRTKTS